MKTFTPEHVFHNGEDVSLVRYGSGYCETHMHDFIELVYITSGSGEHLIGGHSYKIKRGNMLFINYGQTHAFHGDKSLGYINILMKPEFISEQIMNTDNAFELLSLTAFEDFRSSVNKDKPLIAFKGSELLEVENIISIMVREFEEKRTGYKSALQGYMIALLVHVFRNMSAVSQDENDITKRITPDILEYIETHFAEKISLDTLAKRSFYNPAYFSRLFKECHGVTLSEYVHQKRISTACRLLLESEMSVDDICSNVGYSDKTLFYKHFKRIMGMTPNIYKTKSNTAK